MKVLLLWNRDKEDGWLLGDLSFVVSDSVGDYDAALEELKSMPISDYLESFFKDDIVDSLLETGEDEDTALLNTFKFDKVQFVDYLFSFEFVNNEGDTLVFTKECRDLIEPFAPKQEA